MQIVRCNACGNWIGKENNLGLHHGNTECCPECRSTEALMDVVSGCNFDDQELEKLWDLLGEISVDNDDGISDEFLGFPEGTNRIEIWRWFDEHYSNGVAYLLYGEDVETGNYRPVSSRQYIKQLNNKC